MVLTQPHVQPGSVFVQLQRSDHFTSIPCEFSIDQLSPEASFCWLIPTAAARKPPTMNLSCSTTVNCCSSLWLPMMEMSGIASSDLFTRSLSVSDEHNYFNAPVGDICFSFFFSSC